MFHALYARNKFRNLACEEKCPKDLDFDGFFKEKSEPFFKKLIILSRQVQKHRAHWRRVNNALIIHRPLRWGTQGKGGDVWETEQSKLRNSPSYTGSEINYFIQAQSIDLINVPADGIKWLPEFFSFSLTT